MLFLPIPHSLAPLLPFAFDSQVASSLPLSLSALNFKRLKRLVSPESLIKLMEYFHAYVCLPAVPPPAPSSRHAVRCHGTSLFQGYYELPRHLATPLIVSHRFTARHQLIPFGKWNYARKTGLINRIIAPRANVFIFFCSLFSIFSTRLLSFAFFELSCMIFDFCLSLPSSMVAFHFLLNNTGQLFHSRYRFIGLSLSPSAAVLCSSYFSTSFAHFSFSLFFLVTHVYHI